MKSSPDEFNCRLLYAVSLVLSLAFPLFPSPAFGEAQGGTSYQVRDVGIVGNTRVDGSAVRAQLKVVPGAVKASEISADVKAIYQTGFFDQVTARVVDSPKGKTLQNQPG